MAPYDENYTPIQFDFVTGPIEAYASTDSVKQESTIDFHIWTDVETNFTIEIIKKGLVDSLLLTDSGTAEPYPTNSEPWINGCGWPVRYSLTIPEEWQSGAYIAKFSLDENNYKEVLFFVLPLSPGIATKILFQSSVNTYQAYNNWGGKSLYDYNSTENQRSPKVSFNRPYADIWGFYIWDLPFIQWLEKEGYTVEFCTNVDLHADSDLLNNYKLFLSVGHDEYWSWEMRDNIDNFMSQIISGNVAFFSGNTCWWQVRFEPQDEVENRLLVCYKDANLDSEPYPKKTVNWYIAQVNRPENLMTGVSFFNGVYHDWDTMPDAYFKTKLYKHWLLKDTGLQYGGEFGVYDNEILQKHYQTIGYETDAAEYTDMDIKFPFPTGKLPIEIQGKTAPKDFMILASSNLTNWAEIGIGSSGYNNHNGWVTIGIYRKPSAIGGGGFGFTVGTTNWSNGLLYIVENESVEDPWNEIHQITKNVLDILGDATFQSQQFLLDNPDFENWNGEPPLPVGWFKEGNGNIYRISPGHSGSYCMKVDATNGQTWISQNYIPVRTNRQYRVKCWAKGSDPFEYPVNNITIRLQTTDDYNDFAIANYTGTEFWQEISAVGIIINTENILRPARVKIQVASNVIAYFDEIVVEEL